MIRSRIFMLCFVWAALSVPSIRAQDLSNYRDFQLGMDLPKAAAQAGIDADQVRVIHERPSVIQELAWRPRIILNSSSAPDPVEEILFGFYNSQLYRIVIRYDQENTEGLTDQDLIEGVSAKYGKPTTPVATISSSSLSQSYGDSEKVLARWDNSEYSLNLFRFSYKSSYGMLIFSKRLNLLAQNAVAESIRLNELEAPQREIERQKKQAAEKLAAGEKARPANKANFRP